MEQQRHTADSIMDLFKQLPIVKRVRLQAMLKDPVRYHVKNKCGGLNHCRKELLSLSVTVVG